MTSANPPGPSLRVFQSIDANTAAITRPTPGRRRSGRRRNLWTPTLRQPGSQTLSAHRLAIDGATVFTPPWTTDPLSSILDASLNARPNLVPSRVPPARRSHVSSVDAVHPSRRQGVPFDVNWVRLRLRQCIAGLDPNSHLLRAAPPAIHDFSQPRNHDHPSIPPTRTQGVQSPAASRFHDPTPNRKRSRTHPPRAVGCLSDDQSFLPGRRPYPARVYYPLSSKQNKANTIHAQPTAHPPRALLSADPAIIPSNASLLRQLIMPEVCTNHTGWPALTVDVRKLVFSQYPESSTIPDVLHNVQETKLGGYTSNGTRLRCRCVLLSIQMPSCHQSS
ncbi:hypothetical protein BJ138DRAFT_1130130 [Hygrophoropsis aurantiaca]|uniref:Uncharacterized protein n=1 Tax=Hygrophoropsis aurantiaca TaxID=72124 RepID=A0ACB7ZZJ8_9AGAM|nr:hypothetical protein BJ138DRAFT_1130130 [Hygrophoropsis aurantiaca]